jgi:hypothetical protein
MSYCPWCHNNIIVGMNGQTSEEFEEIGKIRAASFAAHILNTCPDAPEAIKAAYKEPYP